MIQIRIRDLIGAISLCLLLPLLFIIRAQKEYINVLSKSIVVKDSIIENRFTKEFQQADSMFNEKIQRNNLMLREDTANDCPSGDYSPGKPVGNCWGDGHYMCDGCKYFRADFAADKNLREQMYQPEYMTFSIIKKFK